MTASCLARWSCVGVLIVILSGCAAGTPAGTDPANSNPVAASSFPAAADPSPGESAVSGVWEGTSEAECSMLFLRDSGRCASVQRITLTMFQHGAEVTGFYKCAFGTQICRNLDESGVIKQGKMTRSRLMMRVMLGDGSMCFFTGIPQDGRFNGTYMCLQGGGIVEQGRFRTQRDY